jgi:phosphate starvation-inducible protein PhoH
VRRQRVLEELAAVDAVSQCAASDVPRIISARPVLMT